MNGVMFQGTGSDVGKSIFVAGLCRLAKNKRILVAPFKPQNMSNNSFVTVDGGEIGRSQAFQAFASGVEPHSDMNPILLKPESNSKTQIIVNGKLYRTIDSKNYKFYKKKLLEIALDSYTKLKKIKPATIDIDTLDNEKELFSALKSKRMELARRRRVPAYIIFPSLLYYLKAKETEIFSSFSI